MKKQFVMGVDTSNYTTSVALIGVDGTLAANIKIPLPVKAGECGLRQSDAVFAHIKNLPVAMQRARREIGDGEVVAIGVSEKPRNVEGSYMPCFLSGVAAATSVSAATDIPIYKFSHQCGHIAAALYSSNRSDLFDREFCAFHVSGGTTEMLRVVPDEAAFKADVVGGTADLNAGQLIDRVGVLMGLPFPCGSHIEELALANTKKLTSRKPTLSGSYINLSGGENIAAKMYAETGDKSLVSAFVLEYISRGLISLADFYESQHCKSEFLFAGGVMSNSIIKARLADRFDASFAVPQLSSDNAVGIAYLTERAFNTEKK
ncbi:MAG: peptidase M22 [Clostridia bacterium]|nr:peptidase M22 [Clostridia bacterium]